jgi:hypothetical protein
MVNDRLAEFRVSCVLFCRKYIYLSRLQTKSKTTAPVDAIDIVPSSSFENNRLLHDGEPTPSIHAFLDRVSQLHDKLRTLETFVDEVRVKHSQLLLTPGTQPRSLHFTQYYESSIFLELTEELNAQMDSFRLVANSCRDDINRKLSLLMILKQSGGLIYFLINGLLLFSITILFYMKFTFQRRFLYSTPFGSPVLLIHLYRLLFKSNFLIKK